MLWISGHLGDYVLPYIGEFGASQSGRGIKRGKLFQQLSFVRSVALITLLSFLATSADLPILLAHGRAYASIYESGTAFEPVVPESMPSVPLPQERVDVGGNDCAVTTSHLAARSKPSPHRLLLAMLNTTPAAMTTSLETVAEGATENLGSLLAEAEDLRTSQDYAGAVRIYFDILETSPRTAGGHLGGPQRD